MTSKLLAVVYGVFSYGVTATQDLVQERMVGSGYKTVTRFVRWKRDGHILVKRVRYTDSYRALNEWLIQTR